LIVCKDFLLRTRLRNSVPAVGRDHRYTEYRNVEAHLLSTGGGGSNIVRNEYKHIISLSSLFFIMFSGQISRGIVRWGYGEIWCAFVVKGGGGRKFLGRGDVTWVCVGGGGSDISLLYKTNTDLIFSQGSQLQATRSFLTIRKAFNTAFLWASMRAWARLITRLRCPWYCGLVCGILNLTSKQQYDFSGEIKNFFIKFANFFHYHVACGNCRHI
jgi:hypothetical protein